MGGGKEPGDLEINNHSNIGKGVILTLTFFRKQKTSEVKVRLPLYDHY